MVEQRTKNSSVAGSTPVPSLDIHSSENGRKTTPPNAGAQLPDELARAWAERGIATSANNPARAPRRRGRAHTPKHETT